MKYFSRCLDKFLLEIVFIFYKGLGILKYLHYLLFFIDKKNKESITKTTVITTKKVKKKVK